MYLSERQILKVQLRSKNDSHVSCLRCNNCNSTKIAVLFGHFHRNLSTPSSWRILKPLSTLATIFTHVPLLFERAIRSSASCFCAFWAFHSSVLKERDSCLEMLSQLGHTRASERHRKCLSVTQKSLANAQSKTNKMRERA